MVGDPLDAVGDDAPAAVAQGGVGEPLAVRAVDEEAVGDVVLRPADRRPSATTVIPPGFTSAFTSPFPPGSVPGSVGALPVTYAACFPSGLKARLPKETAS